MPGPTIIKGTGFNGDLTLSREEVSKLLVTSTSETTNLIPNYNGKITATITLKLRNNNHTVDEAVVALSGNLFEKDKAFKTAAFWGTSDVSLVLEPFPGNSFTFPPGALVSNYLDFSNIPHKLVRKDAPLSPEEIDALDISGFCLRMFLHPIAQDWVGFTLLLFPLPRAKLLTTQLQAGHHGFPGFKIWPTPGRSGSIPLHPQSEGVFPGKLWGSPLAPGLIPGAPWGEVEGCPSARDLRGAVFFLLRSASLANFEKDAPDLAERWASINASDGADLRSSPPALLWPEPPQPPAPAGGRTPWPPPPPLSFF